MSEPLKNNYQILEEIGRERFGTIWRCFCPERDEFLACKILIDPVDRQCLENEHKIMTHLSPHPNIVQLFDVFDSDDSLCLVMELCEIETLYDRVAQRVFSEAEAAFYMNHLLQGIAHCHQLGVIHRDIKPDKLLFDSHSNLKLADFGSAVWSRDGRGIQGIVGTPYCVAPEVLMGRDYDEKVDDVWSAGVVLYIMLSGVPPFCGESVEDIFDTVTRSNLRFPTKVFRSVSVAAKDLLRKMICRDASRRFTAAQALSDSFTYVHFPTRPSLGTKWRGHKFTN